MNENTGMNEIPERPPLIIECPHCHTRVIPQSNNVCPNCHEDVTDISGVDRDHAPFTVSETEEFPSYCHSCNQYTDRYVRVTSDNETFLEQILFKNSLPEDTTKVFVFLPECELCSDKDVELVDVDYEHQTMKIMVHHGFRDRVLQYRQSPRQQIDADFDGDL